MESKKQTIEPFLLALLARRFDSITKEMTNTLLRSARSGVVNTGRDFSCAIVDNDCRAVSVAVASPSHTGAAGDQIRILKELFGEDIHPGDCFINTCSYYGNTHNGDFTIFAPVFYQGECLFYTLSRAHQADIGAPIPSSYLAYAKTIYEEGLQLPCVRIQREYRNIEDVVRICKIRIRVPEQWYGDYLAQIGAVRTGERRLIELCKKYGVETVTTFLDEWQNYGARRMAEEIRKLPNLVLEGAVSHDPVPEVAPEGIPIRAKVKIDADEGIITVDLRDNIDNVPGGFNLSEATVQASVLIGILHNIDPTIPHNEGAFSRIKIEAREGSVVGIPKYPVGTGLATTNVADRLTTLMDSIFAQLGFTHGVAEGSTGLPASPVVSGTDWRHDHEPFVNQLMVLTGGPGLYGYDGWQTYGVAQDNGVLHQDSIEIDEQKYPIIFDRMEFTADSAGDGQWRGAPALDVVMGPRHDPATFCYFNDQHSFPARGVLGGRDARPSNVMKLNIDTGETTQLPQISDEVLHPNERLLAQSPTGGGYGDPLDRDPELVRWDAREGLISPERARDVYGVILNTQPELYTVDFKATEKLRRRMKDERSQS
jgi:N-methylhydantoinase B